MAKRLARKAERDWPAGRPQDAALTTMSESAAFVKPQFVVLGSVISEYRSLGPSQGRPDPRVGRDTDKRDESRSHGVSWLGATSLCQHVTKSGKQ